MDVRFTAIMFAVRRYGLPVVMGAAIGWLANHGYDNWASVGCSVADALAVYVEECGQ
jgi:hypothetical protein